MEIQTTVKIDLTKEEFDILNKACNILGDLEMNTSETDLCLVQRKYVDSVYGVEHENALSVAVDFLDMLLTDYVKNK
jgi:hypothetical protein